MAESSYPRKMQNVFRFDSCLFGNFSYFQFVCLSYLFSLFVIIIIIIIGIWVVCLCDWVQPRKSV